MKVSKEWFIALPSDFEIEPEELERAGDLVNWFNSLMEIKSKFKSDTLKIEFYTAGDWCYFSGKCN